MQKLLITLVVLAALGIAARVAISIFSNDRIATGLDESDAGKPTLKGCDGLLNCVASTASNQSNAVEPFQYSQPASEVISAIGKLIASQTGTQIITQNENYLHATYKTRLMGYTDDLELLLDEDTGTLHVRSASRLGKSDLGANRKRVENLRELFSRQN